MALALTAHELVGSELGNLTSVRIFPVISLAFHTGVKAPVLKTFTIILPLLWMSFLSAFCSIAYSPLVSIQVLTHNDSIQNPVLSHLPHSQSLFLMFL